MNGTPLIKKGTYRHYKNKQLYEVLDVALQTETNELLVVYRPLYESEHELFARPYDMFIEKIEVDGQSVPRFERVDS
jgi:hypothetical protein